MKKPVAIIGVLVTLILFILAGTMSEVMMLDTFERFLLFAFLLLLMVSFIYMLVVAE
jgi:hypothetical protein